MTNNLCCDGCSLCCENEAIILTEQDDQSLYETHEIQTPMGLLIAIKMSTDNKCIYLKSGQCSIYEIRPQICRTFDCRKFAASFLKKPRHLRRRLLREDVVDQHMIDTGKARIINYHRRKNDRPKKQRPQM